jgi:hypothetical protein
MKYAHGQRTLISRQDYLIQMSIYKILNLPIPSLQKNRQGTDAQSIYKLGRKKDFEIEVATEFFVFKSTLTQ